jgi:hypothetical protein
MREFIKFPADGFYVVLEPFQVEHMGFRPGEPVGIIRWGTASYVRITKTGQECGGWANYMEVEHMPKLRLLSCEEVSALAGGKKITPESWLTITAMTQICKFITGSVSLTPES